MSQAHSTELQRYGFIFRQMDKRPPGGYNTPYGDVVSFSRHA
jgi:hypothetical protein